MRQQQAQYRKTLRRQENVSDSPNSQSQLKDKQSRPKVGMGTRVLKEQTQKANAQVGKYCDICTPNGCMCPSTWANSSNHSDKEELEN